MLETEALNELINMGESKFQKFFSSLPPRVRLCCQGGLVDWKKALPQWYIITKAKSEG